MAMWFYGIALLIVLVLCGLAGYLHLRLYRLRVQRDIRTLELAEKRQKLLDGANQSIQIICRALVQRQVEPAEASLRICGLLDQLQVGVEQRSDLWAFAKLADEVRHIPILGEWQALPKTKQREYQKLLSQYEDELGEAVRACAKKILGRKF